MGEVSNPGASLAQVAAMMPQPAMVAPPAVAVDSAAGVASPYARSDHTHESRLQARRIQVTPNAQGEYVYTFPKPYLPGVIPIINVTAETPAGQSYRNDASILQGSTLETQTTIVITKLNATVVATILGGIINVLTPQTGAVWVNIMSRAPS